MKYIYEIELLKEAARALQFLLQDKIMRDSDTKRAVLELADLIDLEQRIRLFIQDKEREK